MTEKKPHQRTPCLVLRDGIAVSGALEILGIYTFVNTTTLA